MGCDLEDTKDGDPKNRGWAAMQVRYINMNVKPLECMKGFLKCQRVPKYTGPHSHNELIMEATSGRDHPPAASLLELGMKGLPGTIDTGWHCHF